jgi:type II secretory pathway pseudopilin PulG
MADRSSNRRAGFTLTELLVVSVLMMALALVTTQVWRFLSADMTDLAARARLAKELRLAVESIREDMGSVVGATPVGTGGVLLCKDGGPSPNDEADWAEPDRVVQYYFGDGKLFRLDQSTGAEIVVAGDVSSFTVEDLTESLIRMVIQVRRGDLSRQVTLLWSRP